MSRRRLGGGGGVSRRSGVEALPCASFCLPHSSLVFIPRR